MPGSGADIHRDGTAHVLFEPLDFLARLAALVPPPRLHLTRYHGVFAAHSRYRAQITPAGRGSSARNADSRERPLVPCPRPRFQVSTASAKGPRRSPSKRLSAAPAAAGVMAVCQAIGALASVFIIYHLCSIVPPIGTVWRSILISVLAYALAVIWGCRSGY